MAESVPLQMRFKKMYADPINPDSVFESMEDAVAYATGPTGAAGEIIGVKSETSDKYNAYIINTDKTISTVIPDDVTNDIKAMGDNLDEILQCLVWNELP